MILDFWILDYWIIGFLDFWIFGFLVLLGFFLYFALMFPWMVIYGVGAEVAETVVAETVVAVTARREEVVKSEIIVSIRRKYGYIYIPRSSNY